MSIREKDCYILTSLKIRSASHTHICQATKYHLSLILMASRALYNFNWPLRWRSARDYFTILARCRPATPRVSILKPPEKLEAVNPSPGCLSQAVKPRVSDNWPLIGQYLPLIGRCPVTSPWPAPCDRDNVSAHRRLSVSQGIRLSPNKCRHWRSTITRTRNFEGLLF